MVSWEWGYVSYIQIFKIPAKIFEGKDSLFVIKLIVE